AGRGGGTRTRSDEQRYGVDLVGRMAGALVDAQDRVRRGRLRQAVDHSVLGVGPGVLEGDPLLVLDRDVGAVGLFELLAGDAHHAAVHVYELRHHYLPQVALPFSVSTPPRPPHPTGPQEGVRFPARASHRLPVFFAELDDLRWRTGCRPAPPVRRAMTPRRSPCGLIRESRIAVESPAAAELSRLLISEGDPHRKTS